MLDMDMEFRKGILFVRLDGDINKTTYKKLDKELNNIIKINGIKYVLLNMEKVKKLDNYGMKSIMDSYNSILENNGKLLICGLHNDTNYNMSLLDNLYQINDELKAFNLVRL